MLMCIASEPKSSENLRPFDMWPIVHPKFHNNTETVLQRPYYSTAKHEVDTPNRVMDLEAIETWGSKQIDNVLSVISCVCLELLMLGLNNAWVCASAIDGEAETTSPSTAAPWLLNLWPALPPPQVHQVVWHRYELVELHMYINFTHETSPN